MRVYCSMHVQVHGECIGPCTWCTECGCYETLALGIKHIHEHHTHIRIRPFIDIRHGWFCLCGEGGEGRGERGGGEGEERRGGGREERGGGRGEERGVEGRGGKEVEVKQAKDFTFQSIHSHT